MAGKEYRSVGFGKDFDVALLQADPFLQRLGIKKIELVKSADGSTRLSLDGRQIWVKEVDQVRVLVIELVSECREKGDINEVLMSDRLSTDKPGLRMFDEQVGRFGALVVSYGAIYDRIPGIVPIIISSEVLNVMDLESGTLAERIKRASRMIYPKVRR